MIALYDIQVGIVTLWNANPSLSGVALFSDRKIGDVGFPYCVLTGTSDVTRAKTRSLPQTGSNYREQAVDFKVYHGSKSQAAQLAKVIQSIVDNATLFATGGVVLNAQVNNAGHTYEEDQNVWVHLFTLVVLSVEDRLR